MASRIALILLVLPFAVFGSPSSPQQQQQQQQNPSEKCDCKPVDGRWTEWSSFTPCSKTCGVGVKSRKRYCANPMPQLGGKKCVGKPTETAKCDSKKDCPVNGGWSSWKVGPCLKGGKRTDTRTCTNPKPEYCGAPCPGSATRTQACKIPQPPPPPFNLAACKARCTKACAPDNHPTEGCAQYLSCQHACRLRSLGLSKKDCEKQCGVEFCFPEVKGIKFNLCRACRRQGCKNKFATPGECRLGCY